MFQTSNQWLIFVLDVSAKSLLLAILVATAIKLLRLRDSNLKHRIWSGVLAGMLALPLLSHVLPSIAITIPQSWVTTTNPTTPDPELAPTASELAELTSVSPVTPSIEQSKATERTVPPDAAFAGRAERTEAPATAPTNATPSPVVSNSTSSEPPTASWATAAFAFIGSITLLCWAIVTAFFSLRLLAGLLTGWRLRNRANVITDEVALLIGDVVDEAKSPSRATRVRGLVASSTTVRESPETCVPVTVGWFRPTVLLPAEWRTWPLEKLEAIIAHEFTHVARRDFLVALAAEFNQCLYWFHPVSWWLKKRLSDLAEEVCDDAAIGQSGDRTGYARHLLEVAAQVSESNGRVIQPGLAMARKSNVESRISTILDFKRPLSQRLSMRTAALVILVTIPVVATAAAIRAVVPEENTETVVSDEESSDAKVKPDTDEADENVRVHGQIVDENGRPMPSALVRLYGAFTPNEYASPGDFELVRTLKLDDQGRFDESVPIDSLIKPTDTKFPRVAYTNLGAWSMLAVSAPGYGYEFVKDARVGRTINGVQSWTPSFMAGPVTVKLRKAEPIRGRVLDLEGQPVPGAVVSVYKLAHHDPARIAKWLKEVPKRPIDPATARMAILGGNDSNWSPDFPSINSFEMPPECVAPVSTNGDGRFELPNLASPNDVVVLRIRGDGIVDRLIHVVARDMQPVFGRAVMRTSSATTFHGRDFGYIAQPSVPVFGVVRDIETKEPLPNVTVACSRIYDRMGGRNYIVTQTDDKGRYRIEGLPIPPKNLRRYDRNNLAVRPGKLPYIANDDFPIPDGDESTPLEFNIEMRRAVMAKGRITNDNGTPVAATIVYAPFSTNANAADYGRFSSGVTSIVTDKHGWPTNENGEFEVPVIPGRGVLVAKTKSDNLIQGFGADDIEEFKGNSDRVTVGFYIRPGEFHSMKAIDVPKGGKSVEVAMRAKEGESFTIRFIGPDGQPLNNVGAQGLTSSRRYQRFDKPFATARGFAPGKTREVFFSTADRKLRRIVHITAQKDQKELTVQLLPVTYVRGRLVDTEDRPVGEVTIRAGRVSGGILNIGSPVKTDAEGRFEIALSVGAKYDITVVTADSKQFRIVEDLENAKPKHVDFGDIILDESAAQWSVLKAKQKPKVSANLPTAQPNSDAAISFPSR